MAPRVEVEGDILYTVLEKDAAALKNLKLLQKRASGAQLRHGNIHSNGHVDGTTGVSERDFALVPLRPSLRLGTRLE